VNRKVLSGVLAGIGMLALSTAAAQASGGGTPSPLTSFFVCKSISSNESTSPPSVDIDSTEPGIGWGFNLPNARIGNATLACAFARLFPANSSTHTACTGPNIPPGCNELSPQTTNATKELKCYAISVGRGPIGNQPLNYVMTDALVGNDPDVSTSSVQYLCGPAHIFNPHQ
jgi:hypothetical protein